MHLVKSTGKKGEKSRQTRQRILRAARELFVEQGYGATTLQAIADRAGVAVQTIYFAFGNKPSLLKELVDVTIAGDDEAIPTMQRAWFLDALAADTAQEHLRRHVAGTRQVLQRVAAITDVLRSASAQDPSIASLWQYETDPRLEVQTTAARSIMAKPGARAGVSAEHAADVLFGLLSPELYLLFVRDRGWTPGHWEQWTYDTLRTQLCVDV
ncbi:TetR/AcrR family transcriptional regulator [Planosporangium thailandense]|uniref:TetR/AcrR family transcriptional regulator n=1 Tax=Planosporangium thailandense TaxID=765197 RepID=A0ABX0Y7B5_9ACTN|nr:TetR/AcrR family transcriptional regulator [Planosporangium thailandense]NJC74312.1 TetR/AcrR family transcriptional regulator [Planosporangium thailandense]